MNGVRFDDLPAFAVLVREGFGDWGQPLEVGAEIVRGYADVTGTKSDPTDPIAGLLILSLAPHLIPPAHWSVTGHTGALNLGSPHIRFPQSAPVGATLRGRRALISATPHPRGTVLSLGFEVTEQAANAPCLTAQVDLLYLAGGPK